MDTQCSKIVEKFPGFVHVKDVAGAQNHADAKAIILEDYPANQTDIEEFNEKVIRLWNCFQKLNEKLCIWTLIGLKSLTFDFQRYKFSINFRIFLTLVPCREQLSHGFHDLQLDKCI